MTPNQKQWHFTREGKSQIQCPVVMGKTEIEPSVQETHLGIVRTPDNKADAAVLDQIKTARKTSYSLLGLGMRRMSQVHPSTSLKLLLPYIQPSLIYGFETLRTTPQNLLKMETFYRGILRRMQNLLNETASYALHILLGTLPLEAHLDTQVLSLFARLLHLPDWSSKKSCVGSSRWRISIQPVGPKKSEHY